MKHNLAIDAVALVLYAVVSLPSLTGVGFHEWASVALFVLFIVHCAVHYDWVVDVAKGARDSRAWARQGNLALDALILVAFMVVMVSGLGISGTVLPSFGLVSFGYYVWGPLHSLSAKVLLALLLIHLVAHWRWIARQTIKRNRSGLSD